MTEDERETKIREVVARYRLEIDEIKREFNKEIDEILEGIHQKKIAEIKSKLEIKD